VAQVHFEHILLQIVKETSGYIHNVPSGHLAGHIVKVITMCPLITLRSKWWAHCESNLARHILSYILKETHGFFHKVPPGHLVEHIVKELNMYLPVTCWLNCSRNHNVITMETLGKWGSAPSVFLGVLRRWWQAPLVRLFHKQADWLSQMTLPIPQATRGFGLSSNRLMSSLRICTLPQ